MPSSLRGLNIESTNSAPQLVERQSSVNELVSQTSTGTDIQPQSSAGRNRNGNSLLEDLIGIGTVVLAIVVGAKILEALFGGAAQSGPALNEVEKQILASA